MASLEPHVLTIISTSKPLGSGWDTHCNDFVSLSLDLFCRTARPLCSTFPLLAEASRNYFHWTCEWLNSPSYWLTTREWRSQWEALSKAGLGYIQACQIQAMPAAGRLHKSLPPSFQITGLVTDTGQSLPTKCFHGFCWTMAAGLLKACSLCNREGQWLLQVR